MSNTMIAELTETQLAMLASYRNAGLNTVFSDGKPRTIDVDKATEFFNRVYRIAGFSAPKKGVIVMESIEKALRELPAITGLPATDITLGFIGDSINTAWLHQYSFFIEQLPELKINNADKKNLLMFRDFAVNGNVFCNFQFDDLVALVPIPIIRYKIHPTRGYLLHAEKNDLGEYRKAIEFSDGTGFYALEGRIFSKTEFDIFKRIVDRDMSLTDILAIKNVDILAIALSLIDPEQLLKDKSVTPVDVNSRHGNSLYYIDLDGMFKAQFLYYKCPTTRVSHMKYVAMLNRTGQWVTASEVDFQKPYTESEDGFTPADVAQAYSHHCSPRVYYAKRWES